MSRSLAYYVSAHGYGHGVRSSDILCALVERDPTLSIEVITDLPQEFLRNRVPHQQVCFRRGSYDVGMVQLDSIRVDVPATLERVLALKAREDDLRAEALSTQDALGADLVVCDIPSIPLEAAAQRKVPRFAVGNFAWDWIYSPFVDLDPRWQGVIEMFQKGYRKADLLMRLPFSEPMSVFENQADLNLLAKPGNNRRREIAEQLQLDTEKKWVLLSFTTLDWDHETASRVGQLEDYCFFTVGPLGWDGSGIVEIDREVFSFSEVIASVDGVISKPGYGLLSDCVVNETPLLYAEREDFIEYPILVEAIERYIQNVHIPANELYMGKLEGYLEQLWNAPAPRERLSNDGAARAAEIILG